jgi:hypothetical protein
VGDYRFDFSQHRTIAIALIVAAAASAALGLVVLAWRARRAPGPLVYVATSLIAAAYLLRSGSPYADGKTLAVASAAVVFAALAGAAWLWGTRLRIVGGLLTVAIAGGVLWTNALGYHDVALAPHDRFEELSEIGELVDGRGPTFFNEFEQFAPYFLREAEPVGVPGASVHFRSPKVAQRFLATKLPYDLDELDWRFVRGFPYVVVRRSPFASRPGAGYRRVLLGEYYELWHRAGGPRTIAHVGPDDGPRATAEISCAKLRRLAARAEGLPGGRLAYARRSVDGVVLPSEATRKPRAWTEAPADPSTVFVNGPGEMAWTVEFPRRGEWRVWLSAPFGRAFELRVDGDRVGDVSYELGNPGQYLPLGTVRLDAGPHELRLVRDSGDFRAGDGRDDAPLGPLVFERVDAPAKRARVVEIEPSAYRSLCGEPLDWVEVVAR